MAGVEGFEPSQAVLETDVLPLTLYPYEIYLYIISQKNGIDNIFFINYKEKFFLFRALFCKKH